jgi:hypothetical protein
MDILSKLFCLQLIYHLLHQGSDWANHSSISDAHLVLHPHELSVIILTTCASFIIGLLVGYHTKALKRSTPKWGSHATGNHGHPRSDRSPDPRIRYPPVRMAVG